MNLLRINSDNTMNQEIYSSSQENKLPMAETDPFAGYRKGDAWCKEYEMDNKMFAKETKCQYDGDDGTECKDPDSQKANTIGESTWLSDSNPFKKCNFKSIDDNSTFKSQRSDSSSAMYETPATTISSSATGTQYPIKHDYGFGANKSFKDSSTHLFSKTRVQQLCEDNGETGTEDSYNFKETDIQCCQLMEQNQQHINNMDECGSLDLELGTSSGIGSNLSLDFQQLGHQYTYTPYRPYTFIAPPQRWQPKNKPEIVSSLPNMDDCTEPPVSSNENLCSNKSWVTARSIYTNEPYVRDLCNKLRSNKRLDKATPKAVFNKPVPHCKVTKPSDVSHQSGDDKQKKVSKRFSWLHFSRHHCDIKASPPKQVQFSTKKRILSFKKLEDWKIFQGNAVQSNENPVPLDSALTTFDVTAGRNCSTKKESKSNQNSSHHFKAIFSKLGVLLPKKNKKPKDSTKRHFQKLRLFIHKFSWLKNCEESLAKEESKKQMNSSASIQANVRGCLKVAINPNEKQELARVNCCDQVDAHEKSQFEALYKKIQQQREYSPQKYRLQQAMAYYDRVKLETSKVGSAVS